MAHRVSHHDEMIDVGEGASIDAGEVLVHSTPRHVQGPLLPVIFKCQLEIVSTAVGSEPHCVLTLRSKGCCDSM